MSLRPCPPWEYQDHGNHQDVLRQELSGLLRELREGAVSVEHEGKDTRPVHLRMFRHLSPPDMPYFAGHYRGEDFPCLVDYEVGVTSDAAVGVPSEIVGPAMHAFAEDLMTAVSVLDASFDVPNITLTQEEKLYGAVVIAARAFAEFLTIHPYANGNGHMARFLVWLLLGRFDYWPNAWTIEPRPNTADYVTAIAEHRRGRAAALERMILEAIV